MASWCAGSRLSTRKAERPENDSKQPELAPPKRGRYPRLEDDVKDKFGHEYYGLPKGTRESQTCNELDAPEANLHDLLPGETVLVQYDVYYPGELIPMWLFILRCIFTLGCYYPYYHCSIWCINRGWCTPSKIEMERGRLAVTSQNRLLVWKTKFVQIAQKRTSILCGLDLALMNLCCGKEPVTSESYTTTAAYLLTNVAELVMDTSKVPSYLCGLSCCGEKFQGSLKVYFKKFDTLNTTATTLQCSSVFYFEKWAAWLFNNGPNPLLGGDGNAQVEFLEVFTLRETDSLFDYEHKTSEDCFLGLAHMYKGLTAHVILERGGTSPWTQPQDTFCKSNMRKALEVAHAWGSTNSVSESKVDIPTPWVNLAQGETVVAAEPNMYVMTCADYIKSLCTCGIYFCRVLGDKRKIRPSLVLTTHRLLEITPAVDDACLAWLPSCLTSVFFPVVRGMLVRSLFPREIFSGVLRRDKSCLYSTICTDAGAVSLSFDQLANKKLAPKLAFVHALMSTVTRQSLFEAGEEEVQAKTGEEKTVVPFAHGEQVLARFSGNVPDDFCTDYCPGLCTKKSTYYPGCCLVPTCGVVPMYSNGSAVLTTASLYVFKQRTNNPWGCWACLKALVKNEDWQLLWTPLSHLVHTEVNTLLIGNDSCSTRSCKGNCIGNNL